MDNLTITVRQSKYYRSRLVPFNRQVKEALMKFLRWRKGHNQPQRPESHLFMTQHNEPFRADTLRGIFQRIRANAGIRREDGAYYQPRLHDLRYPNKNNIQTFMCNML